MLKTILEMLAGALSNSIRGGLLKDSPYKLLRQLNKLGGMNIFLATFGIVMFLNGVNIVLILFMLIGLYLGETFGWGRYIGALGGWENKAPEEVAFIDKFLDHSGLTPQYVKINQHTGVYNNIPELKRWGFYGLSIRGAVWGFCITLSICIGFIFTHILEAILLHFWQLHVPLSFIISPELYVLPTLFGSLMGICYFIAIKTADKILNEKGKGWQLGEWLFGSVLILGCTM